ncbi:MAG: hypothetical protein LUD14_08165 [Clostridiales bacterium]|nr:hypothetical protein [Clostridiales bacterium]
MKNIINTQASKGYRLHTISTATIDGKSLTATARIQATMVFEKFKINLYLLIKVVLLIMSSTT